MGWSSLILLISRGFLAYIFIIAGWNKVRYLHTFETEVAAYKLLPVSLVMPFAIVLPYVEIGLGTMFLIGWGVKPAAILTTWLLIVFIMAMGINLAHGRTPNCGCSGTVHHRPISLKLIASDFLLLLLSLGLAVFGGGPLSVDGLSYTIKELLFFNWILPFGIIASSVLVIIKLVKRLLRLLALSPL